MSTLKQRALHAAFRRYYAWRLPEFTGGFPIVLDYPVQPSPRYPVGQRPHPRLARWFEARRAECHAALDLFDSYRAQLEAIPMTASDELDAMWRQPWFSLLDGMAAYAFVASRRPRRIVEVGSGNSTKFMARAIRDHRLQVELTSIDPQPRAEIDRLCTQVRRQPFETVEPTSLGAIAAGDFVFIDNSHRAFTNSDVTAFFLDVLPELQPGVVVHIHDIFLPWDYPAEWSPRFYSEQYLLAAWLLANPERLRLLASNCFLSFDPELRDRVRATWSSSPLAPLFAPGYRYGDVEGLLGVSFWAEISG
jgi:hypothetical protein